MKINVLKTVFTLSFFYSLCAYCQPVLTYTNCTPIIGDYFSYNTTNSVSPGSGGANQTWNLSAMVVSATDAASVVSVASTPNPSFPNANLSVKTGTLYQYYKSNTTSLQNYSAYTNGPSGFELIQYTNPEDQLHFPFNYNDSYTDTWQGTFTLSSNVFIRKGTTTVTADGYGILTTPAGTYTNVLRVHLYSAYKDSMVSNGFSFNRVHNEYRWYSDKSHYPYAGVYTTTNSSLPTSNGGFYIDNIVNVGINENIKQDVDVSIYPNPANNQLHLKFLVNPSENTEIQLLNVHGQLIKKYIPNSNPTTMHSIDIGEFSNGIYFLNIKSKEGTTAKKFIIER